MSCSFPDDKKRGRKRKKVEKGKAPQKPPAKEKAGKEAAAKKPVPRRSGSGSQPRRSTSRPSSEARRSTSRPSSQAGPSASQSTSQDPQPSTSRGVTKHPEGPPPKVTGGLRDESSEDEGNEFLGLIKEHGQAKAVKYWELRKAEEQGRKPDVSICQYFYYLRQFYLC